MASVYTDNLRYPRVLMQATPQRLAAPNGVQNFWLGNLLGKVVSGLPATRQCGLLLSHKRSSDIFSEQGTERISATKDLVLVKSKNHGEALPGRF